MQLDRILTDGRAFAMLLLVSICPISMAEDTPPAGAPTEILNAPSAIDPTSCQPRWPFDPKNKIVQVAGTVEISALIDANGDWKETKIVKPSGESALDMAVHHAALNCKFKPATKGGQPVEAWITLKHEWVPGRGYTKAALAKFDQCAGPVYPSESKMKWETGTVWLSFDISAEGIVLESRLRRSSGFERLDRAAVQGLEKCRFVPATLNGVPIRDWANMQYVWKLD